MVKWAGHVACIRRWEMSAKVKLENLKGRDHLEDLGVDGRILLNGIIRKQGVMVWTRLILRRLRTSGRLF
jgi:hypothetical protein